MTIQRTRTRTAPLAVAATAAPQAVPHAAAPSDRAASSPLPRFSIGAIAADRTGLPHRLKSGIEALSGVAMHDVRVRYNSPHPARIGALAYARGREIHLAAGQEQHLPHEAWHLVQQAQGRVRPTMQMKGGVALNDDAGLEREADAMGARALTAGLAAGRVAQTPSALQRSTGARAHPATASTSIQMKRVIRADGSSQEVDDNYALQDGEHFDDASQFHVQSGANHYQFPVVPFLQNVRNDLHARFEHVSSAADAEAFPHLNQSVTIKGKKRRQANIRDPRDRARLVKEARDQKSALAYTALQSDGTDVGRIQKSQFGNPREQFFYDSNGLMTPYPEEAKAFEGMTPEMTRSEVWDGLDSVNRGKPLRERMKRHRDVLEPVPLITNLSEVQRSPLMAATANLHIANQAHSDDPQSFRSSFGHSVKRKGKPLNMPGTVVSSGSGAVHRFDAVEDALMNDEFDGEHVRKRIKNAPEGSNLEEARDLGEQTRTNLVNTFQDRLELTDIDFMHPDATPMEHEEAAHMRFRSAVNRNTLPQMGLAGYNFRPLTRPDSAARARTKHKLALRKKLAEEAKK